MRSCAGARVIAIDRSRLVNVHFGASQTSPHVEKRQKRSFGDQRRIADFDPKRKFDLPLLCAISGKVQQTGSLLLLRRGAARHMP